MQEKETKKLSLKKVRLVELSNSQIKQIRGGLEEPYDPDDPNWVDPDDNGLFSIGHECSAENSCRRVSTVDVCYCDRSSRLWCRKNPPPEQF